MHIKSLTSYLLFTSFATLAACGSGSGSESQQKVEVVQASATQSAVPETQMAIVQRGNGGPEVLSYESIAVPQPGAGEVLIKVVAAGINPIDRRFREGGGGPRQGAGGGMGAPANGGMGAPANGGMGGQPNAGMGGPQNAAGGPRVPGSDLAGVIVQLGENVSGLKVGDPVFAKLAVGASGLNGAYAQYAVASAEQAVAKPSDQTFAEAAGLATVGMTAMRTLDHANVSAGQRVFINGIGGGIGSSAAQFSLARGAYVLGTASAKHHDYLKSIGVNEVINYREVQFDEVITEPVDVVIETVSTATANQALNILKAGGQLVSIAGAASADLCSEKEVTCSRIGGTIGRPNAVLLNEIHDLAEQDLYRLNVDTTFPLEEAAAAQDLNFSTGTTGKIILVVDAELANTK